MDTSPTVRDRIMVAADTLYEQSDRRTIPTVDAVRKLAKVNINDASTCMREWRHAHATQADSPLQQVPEKLQQIGNTALSAIWTEAVNLSGETLRLAQAGWDAERADAQILAEQVGSACAEQEEELRVAKQELEKITLENKQLKELLDATLSRADVAEHSLIEARTVASQAETRCVETSKHADGLRQALAHDQAAHAAASSDQAAALRARDDEIASLRRELETTRERWDTATADARTEFLAAIEEAARLRGKLEAIADAKEVDRAQASHAESDRQQSSKTMGSQSI